MFNIFGKNKQKNKRDIEQVIFDVAEYQKDEDFHQLYKLLDGREVFVPVDTTTIPVGAKPGEKYVTKPTDQLKIKNVIGPNNQPLVPAATINSCTILKDGCVGMNWSDFLNMVLKVEGVYGALLQGETSWVGFDIKRIKYILNTYKA